MRIAVTAALLVLSLPTLAGMVTPRIIGGTTAAGQWPWAALVESTYSLDGQTLYGTCSGLLLTPNWVITAAHCLFKENSAERINAADMQVMIGSSPAQYQWQNVQATYLPPSQTSADSFRSGNDIALLKLAQPVTTQGNRYPSIAEQDAISQMEALSAAQRDEYLTVLGWGKTSNSSDTASSTLQQARLDYVPFSSCAATWTQWGETLTNTMLCAGEMNPGQGAVQDTCSGDSGGPLLIDDGVSPPVVGITSFGTSLCGSGVPSVYTSLPSQVAFIESQTHLVDLELSLDEDESRYYSAPGSLGSTLDIAATLTNDSLHQQATGITLSVSGDDTSVHTSLTCEGGCTGRSLPAGSTALHLTASTYSLSGDQQATLTLTATADQGDYRQRNNQPTATVIFSQRPDIAVKVLSGSASADSNGGGTATVTVSVANLSTVAGADASQVYLDLTLPTGTLLASVDDSTGGAAAVSCSGSRCAIGALPHRSAAGSSRSLDLHLTSDSPRAGTLGLTVSDVGSEGEFPADNNTASYALLYRPLPSSSNIQNNTAGGGQGGHGGGGALGWPLLLGLLLSGLPGLRQRWWRNNFFRKASR